MGDIDKKRPDVPKYRKDRKLMQMAIGKTYQQILDFLVEYLYGADANVSQAYIQKQLHYFITLLQEDTAEYVNHSVRKAHFDGRKNQVKGLVENSSPAEIKRLVNEQAEKLGISPSATGTTVRSGKNALMYNNILENIGDSDNEGDIVDFILQQTDFTTDQQVNALVIETYSDILEATENTMPAIKKVVRDSVRDIIQLNTLTDEKYAGQADQLKKQLMKRLSKKGLRERIVKDGFVGIVDKAGRRWSVGTYSDMVVRTKLSQAYTDGVKKEGQELGMDLGVISDHGAKDDCKQWEGVVVSLSGKTSGFPTLKEAQATNEVFHPNCQHTVHLIRDLDQLSSRDRKKAEKQVNGLGEYKKRMKRTRI